MAPFLVLVLAGCAPCPPWSEVEINAEGSIDPAAMQEIQGAFAEFVAWSGREGSCATRIDVFPELEDWDGEFGGDYSARTGQIRLSASYYDPWEATTHELCHAVDDEEGWSRENPDLFELDALSERDAATVEESYRKRAWSTEAFAKICEEGAQDVARWEIVEEVCGIPVNDADLPPRRFVQDRVFRGAPRVPWDAPSFEATAGGTWVLPPEDGRRRMIGFEADRDELLALYEASSDDRRAGPPAQVRRLDPRTGEVRARYAWDPCPGREGEFCDFDLIPGSEGAWLQAHDGREAWLWDLGADEAREAPGCGRTGDLVAGRTLWGPKGQDYDGTSEIWACDVDTGEERLIANPTADLPLVGQSVARDFPEPLLAGSRFALWWPGGGAAWLDEDGETWHLVPLPAYLGVAAVYPLADGPWLLKHALLSEIVPEVGVTFSLLDPLTGERSAPADPCPLPVELAYARFYGGEGWAVHVAYSEAFDAPVFTASTLEIR